MKLKSKVLPEMEATKFDGTEESVAKVMAYGATEFWKVDDSPHSDARLYDGTTIFEVPFGWWICVDTAGAFYIFTEREVSIFMEPTADQPTEAEFAKQIAPKKDKKLKGEAKTAE